MLSGKLMYKKLNKSMKTFDPSGMMKGKNMTKEEQEKFWKESPVKTGVNRIPGFGGTRLRNT